MKRYLEAKTCKTIINQYPGRDHPNSETWLVTSDNKHYLAENWSIRKDMAGNVTSFVTCNSFYTTEAEMAVRGQIEIVAA